MIHFCGGYRALLVALFFALLLASCNRQEPDVLDAPAMAAIKHLTFANLLFKNEVPFVGASEGQLSKDGGNALALIDSAAILKSLSDAHVFQEVGMFDDGITSNTAFAKAISDPFSADPSALASLAKKGKSQGLLWVGREYRIRAMGSFKGERYANWTGEVLCHIYVFDSSGHLALRVAWLETSNTKYQGDTINGAQAVPLLTAAINQAAHTTADILTQASSGKGIPQSLRTEKRTEVIQEATGFAHELGAIGRVLLLVILIGISWVALKSDGAVMKGIGLLVGVGVLYLLIGRGWWKEAVMEVLEFVKEAIFG